MIKNIIILVLIVAFGFQSLLIVGMFKEYERIDRYADQYFAALLKCMENCQAKE